MVASVTFCVLSKIFSRKVRIAEILFIVRIFQAETLFVCPMLWFGHSCKSQLDFLAINVIPGIVYFREIILETSRSVSETTPRMQGAKLSTCNCCPRMPAFQQPYNQTPLIVGNGEIHAVNCCWIGHSLLASIIVKFGLTAVRYTNRFISPTMAYVGRAQALCTRIVTIYLLYYP